MDEDCNEDLVFRMTPYKPSCCHTPCALHQLIYDWPQRFGHPHLGKIQGAAQVLTVLFSAAGPVILSVGKQHQGSFSNIFLIMAPIVAVAAIACWVTTTPTRPVVSQGDVY